VRFACVAVLCACSGGSTTTVTVHARDATLVAKRVGDTWTALAPDAAGDITLALHGPTLVSAVCDQPDFFNFITHYVGPGVDDIDLSCGAGAAGALVAMTLDAPATTQVFAGFARSNGGSQLTIRPGVYDVVAIDLQSHRFEIRRDLAITEAGTLAFDLAATGTPMLAARATITDVNATETPFVRFSLHTARETVASFSTTTTNLAIVPAAALVDGDKQFITAVVTDSPQGTRTARHEASGRETELTLALPPYLTNATATFGSEAIATWQSDARWNGFYFGINDAPFRVLWDVDVHPEWIDAGGDATAITIPDPRPIPGWQPSWDIAGVAGFSWFFQASEESGADFFTASRSGTF
jgi:hypothetical protein